MANFHKSFLRNWFASVALFAAFVSSVSIPVSPAHADTGAKNGYYNRKKSDCNFLKSSLGWHAASTVYSGTYGPPGTFPRLNQNSFATLRYDPRLDQAKSFKSLLGYKGFRNANGYPSSIHKGRWPFFASLPTERVVVLANKFGLSEHIGIQLDGLNTKLFVVVPDTERLSIPQPIGRDISKLKDPLFGREYGEEATALVVKAGEAPPTIFIASKNRVVTRSEKVKYGTRGGKILADPKFAGGYAYSVSVPTYNKFSGLLRERQVESENEYAYSSYYQKLVRYLFNAQAETDTLYIGVIDGGKAVYEIEAPNFGGGFSIFRQAVSAHATNILRRDCI